MSDDKLTSTNQENTVEIQYANFMVHDQPYCIWDTDIPLMTLNFLESVDPKYFEHVGNNYFSVAAEENSLLSSLALRTTYSQALETLFAFIAATLQAPKCAPAWITTYRNHELQQVVKKIGDKQPFPTLLKANQISWQEVSEFVHYWLVLEDKDKEKKIKNNFADLWTKFADDFLDKTFNDEYNSIKHGLRVRVGGFHISIGAEDTPGEPAPKDKMRLLGNSEYGSSYLVRENLLGKRYHMRLQRHYRNWDPEDFVWGLHLISMSIQNVISALKILNGVPAKDVRFAWPTEEETLDEPWKRAIKIGVRSMTGMQRIIPDELIQPFTKEDIKSQYLKGIHLSGIRYRIADDSHEENDD